MDDDEELELNIEEEENLDISIDNDVVEKEVGGITDYEELDNKPSINEVTLIGNKSFGDLGLEELTNLEIENLISSQV